MRNRGLAMRRLLVAVGLGLALPTVLPHAAAHCAGQALLGVQGCAEVEMRHFEECGSWEGFDYCVTEDAIIPKVSIVTPVGFFAVQAGSWLIHETTTASIGMCTHLNFDIVSQSYGTGADLFPAVAAPGYADDRASLTSGKGPFLYENPCGEPSFIGALQPGDYIMTYRWVTVNHGPNAFSSAFFGPLRHNGFSDVLAMEFRERGDPSKDYCFVAVGIDASTDAGAWHNQQQVSETPIEECLGPILLAP